MTTSSSLMMGAAKDGHPQKILIWGQVHKETGGPLGTLLPDHLQFYMPQTMKRAWHRLPWMLALKKEDA